MIKLETVHKRYSSGLTDEYKSLSFQDYEMPRPSEDEPTVVVNGYTAALTTFAYLTFTVIYRGGEKRIYKINPQASTLLKYYELSVGELNMYLWHIIDRHERTGEQFPD